MSRYIITSLTFSLITISCVGIKIIVHEKQPDKKEFYFNSVEYFGRNCKEFCGFIKEHKKISESIYYYNCTSLVPVKVLYNYDTEGKLKSSEYFLSVINDSYEFQTTDDEKHLFEIIDRKNQRGNYKNYSSIKGFRAAIASDNIFSIPGISKRVNRH